jgi:hypothetical protein
MVVIIVLVTIVYNLAMYFIYTRKWPFFEQFRASKVSGSSYRTLLGLGRRAPNSGIRSYGNPSKYNVS